MGNTRDTGHLRNIIAYDSAGRIAIGAAVDTAYLVKLAGAVNITGALALGGALSNGADATTAMFIKQTGNSAANGIYLERTGERTGYYMYIGGGLDSLTFQRNYAGTKSDVLALNRDGTISALGALTGTTATLSGFLKATYSEFQDANDRSNAIMIKGATSVSSHFGTAFGGTFLQNNVYYNGSAYSFGNGALPHSLVSLANGGFSIQTGAASVDPTTKVFVNVSGNMGIATTTPNAKLEINSGNDASAIRITDKSNSSGSGSTFRYTVASYWSRLGDTLRTDTNPLAVNGSTAAIVFTDEPGNYTSNTVVRSSSIEFWLSNNNNAGNIGNVPTLRMSIASTGLLSQNAYVANHSAQFTNSHTTPYGVWMYYSGADPNTADYFFFKGQGLSTTRFEVRSNGGIGNYSANNVNLSDENTKKEIIAMESQWDLIKAFPYKKFKYDDQTHDDWNYGTGARALHKIAPHLVDTEAKDGKWRVYDTDIFYTQGKALQEALLRIEQLEAKLKKKYDGKK